MQWNLNLHLVRCKGPTPTFAVTLICESFGINCESGLLMYSRNHSSNLHIFAHYLTIGLCIIIMARGGYLMSKRIRSF